MRCYNCKYYSRDLFLSCAIDPITASSSPKEGCRDWEPNPTPITPTQSPSPNHPTSGEIITVLVALIVPPLLFFYLIYRAYNPVQVHHPLEQEVLIIKP